MKRNTLTLAATLTVITTIFTTGLMAQENGPGKGHNKGPSGRPGKQMILDKFDTDGDGKLSESEREKARAVGKARRDAIDADGDGKLSKSERIAALKQRLTKDKKLAARMLENFDADESGDLSDAELAKAGERLKNRRSGEGRRGKRGLRGKRGDKKNSPTS